MCGQGEGRGGVQGFEQWREDVDCSKAQLNTGCGLCYWFSAPQSHTEGGFEAKLLPHTLWQQVQQPLSSPEFCVEDLCGA